MPFLHPLRPYTREHVESLNPNQVGVYGIFSNGRCIYVGRGDIRERLLAHLDGYMACVSGSRMTHWTGEVTADHMLREQQLILELTPLCNLRAG